MTDFQELYHKADVQEYRQYILADQQHQLWEKYASLNKTVSHPNIVFAGDSITEYFPIHELLTSTMPLYNRGVHGIDSLQFLEHLSSQILDLAPSKVFLLIGVNDLKKRTRRGLPNHSEHYYKDSSTVARNTDFLIVCFSDE